MRGAGWLGLWCVACSAASAPGGPPRPDPSVTPRAEGSARPPPSTLPAAPVAPSAVSSAPAAEPSPPSEPRPPLHTATGSIACGQATCAVPEQLCCEGFDAASNQPTGLCVDARPGDARQLQQYCQAAAPDTSRGYTCDDSSDCTEGHACCHENPDLGLSARRCVPIPDDGTSPCANYEPCREGTCRHAGGTCDQGKCAAAAVAIPCGAAGTCRGQTPVCCRTTKGPTCTARGACEGSDTECLRASDCYPGQRCCASPFDLFCAGDCTGGGNTFTVCHRQEDCEENTRCTQVEPTDPYQKCMPAY